MRRHNAVPAPRSTLLRRQGSVLAGFSLFAAVVSGFAQAEKPAAGPDLPKPIITPIQIANLPLGLVVFPNGKAMNLTVAMGSAAFRQPGDVAGRLWLITDRGPNIPCADARRLVGIEPEQICNADRAARIHPLPGFAPSIYGIDLGAEGNARINVFIPLKTKSGRPVSGRPIPPVNGDRSEQSFAIDGKPLPPDPSGIDPEAFVRLSDGSFWIAEEFGPSLLEVAADGTILRRLVPSSVGAGLKDADYEIAPVLPPVMRHRAPGRGFEGLAISPDEKFLYVMMQSPLALPDIEAFRRSRNLRIWKIDRASAEIVGQYLYQLDPPAAFTADLDGRERGQSDVHISEIAALAEDRLIVLERIEKTSRIFEIALNDASRIPLEFDNPDAMPSLEMLEGDALAMRGVTPLPKMLVLDTETAPGLPAKIEGMAVMAPNELIVINDNDFGMDGVRTQMFRITLPQPILR